MATEKDIAGIVAQLSAAYPNWNVTPFTVEVYYQDLQDLDADALFLAAKHCRTLVTRDQRFAPSAGEIRAAHADIRRQAQGVPSALEAWGELLTAPKTEEKKWTENDENGDPVIWVRKYEWSHPLVRKVAIMMGFPKFPDWESSESYERAAFLKAYEIELQSYLKKDAQIPEVKEFIEQTRMNKLKSPQEIKQLMKGMTP